MATNVTPNPQDDTYQRYLANQFGSGVGANLNGQGGHIVVDGVVSSYMAAGQDVPASISGQLQELRDIARSEAELQRASPAAREALNFGGAYDPLAVGRRERELVGSITNATRGVYLQPSDLSAATARQAYAEAQAATTIAGQKVTMNNQTIAQGEINLESARLAAEAQDASARGLAAQTARAAAAQAMLDTLGDVSTFDMMNALNADNPQLAQEVFGAGTTRDVQLQTMTLRLAEENAALQAQGAGGSGTAVRSGRNEGQDAITQMGALQMQRSNSIIQEFGADLAGMANGAVPLPEGVQLREVQQAFSLQQGRQVDQNQLTVDLINDRLDVDGVAPAARGAGGREDKVDTGFRILSTMPIEEVAALADAVAAGQPVMLAVPNSELTLTLDPSQATAALAQMEAGYTAQAQQQALASLNNDVVNSFGAELGRMEQGIAAATNGVIPQIVQQALAAEKLALGNVAYGDGDIGELTASLGRVEEAMINAGMSEDVISMVIHDRFGSDSQIANGAMNILGRSPDPQLFTPVTNAFLAQLEARAVSSGNALTPDRLSEMRQILLDDTLTGDEAGVKLETILGYPVGDLHGMLQGALVGAAFNDGFADFMAKMVAGPEQGGLGLLGTGEGQALTRDVQAAIREKLDRGEEFSAESYIQTVQTFASTYSADDAERDTLMGAFFDSLSGGNTADLFRKFDGSLSNDEAAFFAMMNNLSSTGPSSGRGSIPLSELPEALGAQLDAEIRQTVLGHQRFDVANQQTQALSYAVGELLGVNRMGSAVGRVNIPSNIGNNPALLEQDAPQAGQVDVLNRLPPGLAREQQVLDLNPQLTRFVASVVLPQIIGATERPTHWFDMLTLGRTISMEEQAALLSGVDFEELNRLAIERGLIGGQ